MVSPVDQQRVCALLTEAVTVICKNGLTFNNKFCIEGLLGITLDDRNMFLVNIKESIVKGSGNSNNSHQNKSQSMSKAGVFVGMPGMQSNGGRGPVQVGMGRPGTGMSPGMQQQQQQQQMQRRRPGAPQQQVIPPKRPAPGMMPSQPNMGRGQGQPGSMPQEWAALIQLQSQQPNLSPRGRSRGTARRGGFNRMQNRMPGIPGQAVKSPPRRLSQSGVELETREEIERKAAEQARLRSERLQRRRSGGPTPEENTGKGEPMDESEATDKKKGDGSPPKKHPPAEASGAEKDQDNTEKRPQTDPEKKTEEKTTTADDNDNTKRETPPKAEPQPEKQDSGEQKREKTEAAVKAAASTGDSGTGNTKPGEEQEASEGGKQEGDGSWLLSNSSWLLGDLESMASNTAWKDSAQSNQQQQDKAKEDPGEADA